MPFVTWESTTGTDVIIGIGSVVHSSVVIGNNVVIGDNSIIHAWGKFNGQRNDWK